MSASVRVIALGGAGEIGKNMYVVEHDGRMVLIDCGITFPKNDQMGVDIVLPDFSYVIERRDMLEGLILTHGHEDHIGAVPFLLRAVGQVPIYARRFTLGLLRPKLEEHRLLDGSELTEVAYNTIMDGRFRDTLCFCSNNYLGLANHPEVVEAGIKGLKDFGAGTASVRFICGTFTPHETVEKTIASMMGTEASHG